MVVQAEKRSLWIKMEVSHLGFRIKTDLYWMKITRHSMETDIRYCDTKCLPTTRLHCDMTGSTVCTQLCRSWLSITSTPAGPADLPPEDLRPTRSRRRCARCSAGWRSTAEMPWPPQNALTWEETTLYFIKVCQFCWDNTLYGVITANQNKCEYWWKRWKNRERFVFQFCCELGSAFFPTKKLSRRCIPENNVFIYEYLLCWPFCPENGVFQSKLYSQRPVQMRYSGPKHLH